MGILGDLLTGALVAGKTAIDYNAFIALNALVNQYRISRQNGNLAHAAIAQPRLADGLHPGQGRAIQ